MTDKMIDKRERELYNIQSRTVRQERELEKLRCMSMINSILCYQCAGYTDAEKVLEHEERAYHNYLEQYVKKLSRDVVLDLIEEQIASIKSVNIGVYTDSDGLTYNSINWN